MVHEARQACLRVYRESVDRGRSDRQAFETSLRALRLRSPELPDMDAQFMVADWIADHLGQ